MAAVTPSRSGDIEEVRQTRSLIHSDRFMPAHGKHYACQCYHPVVTSSSSFSFSSCCCRFHTTTQIIKVGFILLFVISAILQILLHLNYYQQLGYSSVGPATGMMHNRDVIVNNDTICKYDLPWPWQPSANETLGKYEAELESLKLNGRTYLGCMRNLPIPPPVPLKYKQRPHGHESNMLQTPVEHWLKCEIAYAEREINKADTLASAYYPTCNTSTSHMALATLPAWFYINMDTVEERAKGKELERALERHGLPGSRVTRINAITPDVIADKMIVSIPERHKKRIQGSTELALTISHLFAIKAAYDSGVPYAVISEDDVSFDYEPLWRRRGVDTSFAAVIQDLNSNHPTWEILQTSLTITAPHLESKFELLVKAFHQHGGMPFTRTYESFTSLWSTVAYVIHRRGMVQLLRRYWPGGIKHGLSPEEVLSGKQHDPNFQRVHWDSVAFQFHGASWDPSHPPVSDVVIFSSQLDPNSTYFTPRPLFTSATKVSHHHTDQLSVHALSKEAIRRIMYGV